MLTQQQYLLCKIAEEAAELSQAALKAQQFGAHNFHPVTGQTNIDDLVSEFCGVSVCVKSLLHELGMGPSWQQSVEHNEAKLAKMAKFLTESKRVGCVAAGVRAR